MEKDKIPTMEQQDQIILTREYSMGIKGTIVTLTNSNGDTFTTTSEGFIDFLSTENGITNNQSKRYDKTDRK